MWLKSNTKRLFDVVCVSGGLVIFGWVFILIVVAIFLDERKSILFRQQRVGLNGNEFEVLKFRTMTGGQVTRAGRWLRKSGLDELPQLYNVLVGDMSVVGPRPLTKSDIERLGWQHHLWRWQTKPGLTGLAQIGFGAGAEASLAADRNYFRRSSFLVDAEIVGITFLMNLFGKKRIQRALTRPNRRSAY